METLQTMVLASLLAWASGIRLYMVVCAVGLMGHFDYITLPSGLKVLEHPWVMGSAGFMLAMEFLVDKIPGLDSLWDGIHTFIRIPAGALLAAGATLLIPGVSGHPSQTSPRGLAIALDVVLKDRAAIRLYERLGAERISDINHRYGDGLTAAGAVYVI